MRKTLFLAYIKPMLSALLLLICAHSAFATIQTVAVLPSEGVLDVNELEFLTNKAQEIAVRVLPRGTFEVFPRDVIIRRLGGVENYLKECREAACIVDLGKKAQVDYVSQCSFGKLGSDLTIAFELYKVSTSALVDKFSEYAKDIYSLLAIMEKRIPDGFAKILEPPPEAKTAPPPEPIVEPMPPEPVAVPVPVPVPESVPPAAVESVKESGSEDKEGGKVFSWGIRAGFNFSHLYSTSIGSYNSTSIGSYNSTPGLQLGLVFDWALSDWFHLQPGIMYIQKGAEDYYGDVLTLHYLELPLLLSLKFSALRINAGPYFGICLDASESNISCVSYEYSVRDSSVSISGSGSVGPEGGIIMNLGFDIGMFYVGVFYDIGLGGHMIWSKTEVYHDFIDRTLGFDFGVNL